MKNNKALVWVVAVLAVALIAVVVWQFSGVGSPLYAVYLRSGDLYFGELVRAPYFGLKKVYLLQVNAGNAENPVSVQKFTNVFWSPEDFIKINRDEVVWMTRVSDESQLVQVIRANPGLVPSAPAGGTTPLSQVPSGE
ncbi:MAG: hypothetical protein Q8P88_01120 [Candidatus Jorgensenbacteria bacterium]|nr:hypothetical protein [Candidatus Jorgensenbacteria bacterium]